MLRGARTSFSTSVRSCSRPPLHTIGGRRFFTPGSSPRRNAYSDTAYSTPNTNRNRAAIALVSAFVAGSALWYTAPDIWGDSDVNVANVNSERPKSTVIHIAGESERVLDSETLYSLVWGSNANKTLSPYVSGDQAIRSPAIAHWLDGVALRDLQLQEKHAACIDGRGDVYQWGDGFFESALAGSSLPKMTLRGKNIIQLQLTENKVFALSASGKVYVLAANVSSQELPPGRPIPSSDSWWGTGWLWGEDETVDFAELAPAEPLGWRETFTSISAGNHHLLALTSKGRVFAHPVDKKANNYGQLGFSKFAIPHSTSNTAGAHLHVELKPKSLADPFLNSSSAIRVSGTTTTISGSGGIGDTNTALDDKNIRFCPLIYEVPILKGIEVGCIAAGGRTSFIKTNNGRVLAWGANEFGQLGLGANVALDTIIIPTEVVLWRFVSTGTQSKCSGVTAGGDLTAFTVERTPDEGPTTVDLLMAGNGQYGGLGNNLYTTAQAVPLRVRGVSGLVQYSDKFGRLEAIKPNEISISPTGHVVLALDSSPESGVGGRDVMVWGRNHESELGNGKKSNLAVPTLLQTSSSNPDTRFMLMNREAKEVKDVHGRTWKKNVKVEQHVAVGYKNTVIYWRIVD